LLWVVFQDIFKIVKYCFRNFCKVSVTRFPAFVAGS
jgi:hypothetical protein